MESQLITHIKRSLSVHPDRDSFLEAKKKLLTMIHNIEFNDRIPSDDEVVNLMMRTKRRSGLFNRLLVDMNTSDIEHIVYNWLTEYVDDQLYTTFLTYTTKEVDNRLALHIELKKEFTEYGKDSSVGVRIAFYVPVVTIEPEGLQIRIYSKDTMGQKPEVTRFLIDLEELEDTNVIKDAIYNHLSVDIFRSDIKKRINRMYSVS